MLYQEWIASHWSQSTIILCLDGFTMTALFIIPRPFSYFRPSGGAVQGSYTLFNKISF